MSKLQVTDFSKRRGSPFQNNDNLEATEDQSMKENTITNFEKQKIVQSALLDKVNKKTAEISANKPSDGCFTEVVTHGAFTRAQEAPRNQETSRVSPQRNPSALNGSAASKSLMGFPSSANDLALEAKSDLESDKNISDEVKDKVFKKLFGLVAMVQHTYESKVRIMTEFDKFKDKVHKEEMRREKEHSEQLYKINLNFQNEVVQAIQQLKSELDLTRSMSQDTRKESPMDLAGSVFKSGTDDCVDAKSMNSSENVSSDFYENDTNN